MTKNEILPIIEADHTDKRKDLRNIMKQSKTVV